MPPVLLSLLGLIVVGMALLGLVTGKVIAGSRGFKGNYYRRQDNPLLFYGFIFTYLAIGAFILLQASS